MSLYHLNRTIGTNTDALTAPGTLVVKNLGSTGQQLVLAVELPDDAAMIQQERAYTSPIWYTP